MPKLPQKSRRLMLLLICTCITPTGCSLWPGKSDDDEKDALRELMKAPKPPDLVREAAISSGLHTIRADGVSAVNALAGTGGPADPSIFRDQLIEEMKHRDFDNPNQILESDDTSLVRVQATIPPGARRGDPLDIRVLAPKESRTSDLRGGWLLEARLRQQIAVKKQLMQSAIRQSDVLVTATGPVLTRAAYSASMDTVNKTEGVVISGGRVQTSRTMSLVLRPQFRHVAIATAISSAVNQRFFFFDGSTRRGIAKPIEDDYIEIEVHPRYRDNIPRMMEVVRAVGVKPESSDTQKRLTDLASRLADPATAADAALQLEALGESAVPTLIEGLKSNNQELRFYAAEALAYIDRTESIEVLEKSASDVAAFRAPALLALQGLKQQASLDALKRLTNQPSMETRYGSFCAIRRRPEGKRTLNSQALGSFWFYRVPSTSSPAIVVSLRESAEIVLFGDLSPLVITQFVRGPGGIIVKPDTEGSGKLRISRFQVGQEDKIAVVDSSPPSVIAGIVAVGGGYGDVIEFLRLFKEKNYLADQLAIDPLPKMMRTYYRDQDDEDAFADAS